MLKLSRQALEIATKQQGPWEHQLFSQVLLDEIQLIKELDKENRLANSSRTERVPVDKLLRWMSSRSNELESLVRQTRACIDSPHEDAFGPYGKPGNVIRLVAYARKVAGFYRRALEWSRMVQFAKVDARYIEIPRELAFLATGVTSAIERFALDLFAQTEQISRMKPNEGFREVTVTLKLIIPPNKRLLQHIRRLGKDLKHRKARSWVDVIYEALTSIGGNQPKGVPEQMIGERTISSTAGYIYLLVNPSMEGLVKIGKTKRDPHDRVKELGTATGIPTPFILVFDMHVDDCDQAERYIHARLMSMNARVSDKREFFRIPTNEAVKIILDAQEAVAFGKKGS